MNAIDNGHITPLEAMASRDIPNGTDHVSDPSPEPVACSASLCSGLCAPDVYDADASAVRVNVAARETEARWHDALPLEAAAKREPRDAKTELTIALREALARREFVLHYQPKVSLTTGAWTGVEALLRWLRPGHGMVPPCEFIPLLEESGLIVPVGAWIIDAACKQLAEWRARGICPLPIAVNVSALQIARSNFAATGKAADAAAELAGGTTGLVGTVEAALRTHRVPSFMLELEITESAAMADADNSIHMLERLRAMGVRSSVDDFGTGYSSLSCLRHFPLHTVKIDGSFMREVTESAEGASIAAAILDMAHRLDLKVIAECVETAEQIQFLQAHECDEAQGYYFSGPLPPVALEKLWAATGGAFRQLAEISVRVDIDHACAAAWPECSAFVLALLTGSRSEGIHLIERRMARGHGLVEVGCELIRPALYRVGSLWRRGQVSVAEEHLATSLALSIMVELHARQPAVDRNGKKALLACVRGNHHAVGVQMLSDAFDGAGWIAHGLGANVPTEVLIEHIRSWRPHIVGLSASLPEHVLEVKIAVARLRASLGSDCPAILIGGQGFAASHVPAELLNQTIWAPDAESALAAAEHACRSVEGDTRSSGSRVGGRASFGER
ncbi:EAL domain-containing protein [Cognatilysobacter bugurensis]|uniref:EAL domain-containing protein n=1 Tax=Cognatilysobacter bugurensis TaxID=543356 RepID=A0A918T3B9_9GAMM|nr:EAL domain-containing protein [Lysobacter bugurensis]GHA83922.1 hypothetical protein GCM10007067_22590 [Lysobacter bugurensis]